MQVDDMLWWLYETYKIVVGTRTIRRVFERKGDKSKSTPRRSVRKSVAGDDEEEDDGDDQDGDDQDGENENEVREDEEMSPSRANSQYQTPYAPLESYSNTTTEQRLAQVLQSENEHQQQSSFSSATLPAESELPEDPETIELELQQIALKKREVELKLRMRRLQSMKNTPVSYRKGGDFLATPQSAPSSLFNPVASVGPTPPKRDSRSKKKIEESKRRTAERQERMLRDLERRSRRRDHLTAEWVQSKDIWPLRAQGILANLMHQYGCYTFSHSNVETFEAMYHDLHKLVDLSKGDWVPHIHDEMLRERMKRKMAQLRAKMQKTGEIIGRSDGYGGFQKADDYTGEQAGAAVGDDSEMVTDLQTQPGEPPMSDDQMQYGPVPDHQHIQSTGDMPYAIMDAQQSSQYPLIDHNHGAMLPYGQMNGQQGGMVM